MVDIPATRLSTKVVTNIITGSTYAHVLSNSEEPVNIDLWASDC